MDIAPRLTSPRLAPAEPDVWDDKVRELLVKKRPEEFGAAEQPVFNVFKTLANYPALMKRLAPWGNHVLFKSSLPPREREILILRAGWLARASYEWAHHVEIGLATAGLTVADIQNIKAGPDDESVPPNDAVLLRAADELVRDQFVSDTTWAVLEERFTPEQLMDLVFTVGHYTMMCMALNSFGVQLEPSDTH
jgi:4-carboxymuconolactone decarboxylase